MNFSTSNKLLKNTKNFLDIHYYSFRQKLLQKEGTFYGWGRKISGQKAITLAKKCNTNFILLEDGFIRSLDLGVNNSPSFSLVEDNIGIYYDATVPSKLENILNTYDFKNDIELMHKAKKAMELIRKHHISKYNNAVDVEESFFSSDNKKKILIITQTAGDASLEYGLGNKFTTKQIIDDAIKENPKASIYIKIHPDVISGKKKSDVKLDEIPKQCVILSKDVNPISLLKHFTKVYTKTSGMGMEALILGLDVVCYGMPYYAGWGVTIDKLTCERRKRVLSVEDIFTGAYILYSKYYNPYRNRDSDIVDTILEIVSQRKKAKVPNNRVILTMGDSHIRVFEDKFFKLFLKNYKYYITYVPGATAYGIGNNQSQTNAYNIFKEALEKHNYQKIIISIGEVDTAYALWNIAKRDNKDINEVLSTSIERYKVFLDELVLYAPVIVLSASFSTVSDNSKCNGNIKGVRKELGISQIRRIELVKSFNNKIKLFCENQKDLVFIDFTPNVLNNKTEVVHSWLLNKKNPCDHHYLRGIYALLIIWKIKWN